MDVQREQTTAAWLEGIPPVLHVITSNSSLVFLRRLFKIKIMPFNTWEIKRLETVDKKTLFPKRAVSEG